MLVAGVIGCRQSEAPPSPSRPSSSAAKPVDGGQILRRLESDVATLNFVLQTTEYERYVHSYLHDNLVDLNRDLTPIPALAARWEIGDGGRTYTFHVDPRATFSDGQPVRASDVLFTISKIVDEQSPQFASLFETWDKKASAVVDDRTVRIAFREARVAQLLAFTMITVLPEHVYGKGNFKKDFNTSVVGSGPYTLAGWERGKSILLQRRNDYWREKPHAASVLFKVIAEDAVAWLALQRGDIDEMRVKNDLWANEKDRPEVRANVDFHDVYLLSYNCIAWNLRDPLLSDPRVRNALAMAFDRDSIIRSLYRGQARAISGPFTPDQWAFDPSVTPLTYDAARATALLKEAGWADSNGDGVLDRGGRPLSFNMLVPAGSQAAMEQTQIYQQGLQKIGVKLEIRPLEGAAMFDHIMRGNYQSAFMAWSTDVDPDIGVLFRSDQTPPAGLNIVRYANPELDALIDRSRIEFDQNKRREIFHQMHQLLARDQPYLWTVQVATKWAVNKRVRDVQLAKGLGPFNWYPGTRAWWLAK